MSTEATDGCEGRTPYVTTYDPDGDAPLSTALIFAVAAFKGRDPTVLCDPDEAPLAAIVDPDFVDALPRSETHSWRFEVELWNCRVAVTGKGSITVAPA